MNNLVIVSTQDFWLKLCDARCYRIDRNSCAIGCEVFFTKTPPEEVPGFLEKNIDYVCSAFKQMENRLTVGIAMLSFIAMLIPATFVIIVLVGVGRLIGL